LVFILRLQIEIAKRKAEEERERERDRIRAELTRIENAKANVEQAEKFEQMARDRDALEAKKVRFSLSR
jgi:hypothetical protein